MIKHTSWQITADIYSILFQSVAVFMINWKWITIVHVYSEYQIQMTEIYSSCITMDCITTLCITTGSWTKNSPYSPASLIQISIQYSSMVGPELHTPLNRNWKKTSLLKGALSLTFIRLAFVELICHFRVLQQTNHILDLNKATLKHLRCYTCSIDFVTCLQRFPESIIHY